jgi:hypothetical protein
MFYHVIHCGVIESDPAHHDEWFEDTMRYLADRYPELDDEQLTELRTVGERFARPPKARQTSDARSPPFPPGRTTPLPEAGAFAFLPSAGRASPAALRQAGDRGPGRAR